MAKVRKTKSKAIAVAPARAVDLRAVEFGELMRGAQLNRITLLRLSTQRTEDTALPDTISIATTPATRAHQTGDLLLCGVRFTQVMSNPAGSAAVSTADAEYVAEYQLPHGAAVDREVAAAFSARVALFHVWPYFRELSASLGAKMELPPLLLPLLKPGEATADRGPAKKPR